MDSADRLWRSAKLSNGTARTHPRETGRPLLCGLGLNASERTDGPQRSRAARRMVHSYVRLLRPRGLCASGRVLLLALEYLALPQKPKVLVAKPSNKGASLHCFDPLLILLFQPIQIVPCLLIHP